MAEGLFRSMAPSEVDYVAESAGLHANVGQPPSVAAIEAMREDGIDITNKRSRQLDAKLVSEADKIFVMTQSHLDVILSYFPEATEKTRLLREAVPGVMPYELDVPDPIGRGIEVYRQTRDLIREAIHHIILSMKNESESFLSHLSPQHAKIRVAVGADHGGIAVREKVVAVLEREGIEVFDFGTKTNESVDYPDYAEAVCRELLSAHADFGVLVCTTGIGMSIAANRHYGIRAALVHDADTAELTRRHNHANVLCLAGAKTKPAEAAEIVLRFLAASPEGGRHQRRIGKLDSAIDRIDPEIANVIRKEQRRQSENIELIASENFTSRAVMEAQGSVLTNKYAEGYPGRRWYGGCENVDQAEAIAIERAKTLFRAAHANVQPHSGSQANMAVYFSLLQPGDKILTMDLSHGGHLTHGNRANFSGKFFEVTHYGVSEHDGRIDYDALEKKALELRPKMITAGASAYPRNIDFERMRQIADAAGAYLFVDMAHIAGLVAAGVHPSPIPHAHVVTTTTHKSLRGPRGGLILCREEFAKGIDSQVFPGVQGGPLMHVIAAKAVCFKEALSPDFIAYQKQVVANANALAERLAHNGFLIVSGGTDNHLLLVDLRPMNITGVEAQTWLDESGITVNKNSIPFDTVAVTKSGGIRIGTPAATTRGLREKELINVADWITEVLQSRGNQSVCRSVKAKVCSMMKGYPMS